MPQKLPRPCEFDSRLNGSDSSVTNNTESPSKDRHSAEFAAAPETPQSIRIMAAPNGCFLTPCLLCMKCQCESCPCHVRPRRHAFFEPMRLNPGSCSRSLLGELRRDGEVRTPRNAPTLCSEGFKKYASDRHCGGDTIWPTDKNPSCQRRWRVSFLGKSHHAVIPNHPGIHAAPA